MTLLRYVIVQLLQGFILAFFAFTLIIFTGMVFDKVNKYSWLGLDFLIAVLPLALPTVLTYTVPMAALAACVLVYGRMSSDGEVRAFLALGIPLRRVVRPALLLALLGCAGMFLLVEHFLPDSHYRQRNLTMKALDTFVRTPGGGRHTFEVGPFQIHYDDVVQGVLQKATVIRRDEEGRILEKYIAPSCTLLWRRDPPRLIFTFKKGAGIRYVRKDGEIRPETGILEDGYQHPIPLENLLRDRRKSLEDMSLTELAAEERGTRDNEERLRDVATERHQRLAKSVSPLIFALLGAPMGIMARRANKAVLFAISCLPIFAMYYPLTLWGQTLSLRGDVPAWCGVWMANAAVGVLGCALLYRAGRTG